MTEPAEPHPRDAEAAEYVIGAGSFSERRAFERDIAAEPALAAAVAAWEERLSRLADDVQPTDPAPGVWTAVDARIGAAASEVPNVLAFGPPPELLRLRRSRAFWRWSTGAASAIAAGLAFLIVTGPTRPPASRTLVAVVNRSGELPALIVRVDPRAGTVQVRSVAAEFPPDRSLELWSIVAGAAPRSLGLVSGEITRAALPAEERDRIDGSTIAVTLEPRGGGPGGKPSGPVVYQGKLLPEEP